MVFQTSYSIENDREFRAAIDSALKKVGNLKVAFKLIADDWFKSNKSQFTLKNSGQYPPLSPDYARRKRQEVGEKPIMVYSGRLRDSLTQKTHPDAIRIIGRTALILGTSVEYAIYHQSDRPRSRLPQRKVVFIGPEAPRSAPSRITGRLERFLSILAAEVESQLTE
jgi:phage gpG-like protein